MMHPPSPPVVVVVWSLRITLAAWFCWALWRCFRAYANLWYSKRSWKRIDAARELLYTARDQGAPQWLQHQLLDRWEFALDTHRQPSWYVLAYASDEELERERARRQLAAPRLRGPGA